MHKPLEMEHVRPSRRTTSDNVVAFASMSQSFMLSNINPESMMIAREEFASVNSA